MADKNFIFSMKPYDINTLSDQVAWILVKQSELASRKKLSGLWKLTDKLNATQTPEAEAKRRKELQKVWGGFFLVAGIFMFFPGMMNPREMMVPMLVGLFAIVMGVLYLKTDDRVRTLFGKEAKRLLKKQNASMQGQKLRLIFSDEALTISGAGDSKKVAYTNVECTLETVDLFGLVYESQLVLLQKKELLLGEAAEFTKLLEEKTDYHLQKEN